MSSRIAQPFYRRWRRALIDAQCREGASPDAPCHQWLGEPGPPRDDVCIVMMIKDEADIIDLNLAWHRRLGFRRFIILDNGSTDGSRYKLLAFRARSPEAELLIVDDPTVAYFQNRKTTGLASMAGKLWPQLRWIFPLDADEFVCVRDDLASATGRLENAKATTVYIPYYNAHQLGDGSPCDETVPFYERQIYHRARVEDFKVAFRNLPIETVEMGNHDVAFYSGWPRLTSGLKAGLVYRHYPARSFAHLKSKIVNGGRALAATDYPETTGFHWRDWYRRYQAEGDAVLRAIYDGMRIAPNEAVRSPFPLDALIEFPGTESEPKRSDLR